MLTWIIDLCLRHRVIVLLLAVAGTVAGCLTLPYLDIDAFPDTTPVQVQINTTAPALAPKKSNSKSLFPSSKPSPDCPPSRNSARCPSSGYLKWWSPSKMAPTSISPVN